MRTIKIFDTILRDGEQSPGASMNVDEKIQMAKQLVRLGVDIIEAGFPIASPGDFEAVRRIANEVRGTTIAGLARAKEEDIRRAYEAIQDAPEHRIHTFHSSSDIHLKHQYRISREEALKRSVAMVELARSLAADVEFSAMDATRTDTDYLIELILAVVEAGATTVNIPDTVGYTTPVEFGAMIKAIKARIGERDTGKRKGLTAWLTTTDHKRIGLLYLYAMTCFFLVGMGIGFVMRLVQLAPFQTLVTAQTYNALFTLHGMIMIFLFVIPGLPAVFGNFFLPILGGAKDVSFPRLNLASWYFYMAGAMLAVLSLFTGGGAPDTGWTSYAPFSLKTGTNVSLAVFAAFVLGFSSMLKGINFITTIIRLRAPGMHWFRMPLFCWAVFATA